MLDLDYLKVFGVNGATFATVSLSDIELVFKIVLLGLTCAWTVIKIIRLLQNKDDK